jgi:hypothetical protein
MLKLDSEMLKDANTDIKKLEKKEHLKIKVQKKRFKTN